MKNILQKINNHYKKTNWLHVKDYLEMLEKSVSQPNKDTRSRLGQINGVDSDEEYENNRDNNL